MWWDAAWSLVSGCTPVSEACRRCWAAQFAHRQTGTTNRKLSQRYEFLTHTDGIDGPQFNGTVRFMDCDLLKPFTKLGGQVYAIWTDLFHKEVADSQIMAAFGTMMASPRHDYVICTKRPERMPSWFAKHTPADCYRLAMDLHGTKFMRYAERFTMSDIPDTWPLPNVIGMVTVEDQAAAENRIPPLLDSPFETRALSIEPILGPVDIAPYAENLDWVVIGCESGTKRRISKREWFYAVRDVCKHYDIPLFLKQMDYCARLSQMPPLDGVIYDQFPE